MSNGDEAWFSTDVRTGVSGVVHDSQVTFFVDAEEYYADLRSEVEAAPGSTGLICWVGFDVSRTPPPGESPPDYIGSTPMPRAPVVPPRKPFARRDPDLSTDRTWLDLLTDADARGVMIRGLLNLHPSPRIPAGYRGLNFDLAQKLNAALSNGAIINDFRYLWLNGTHHQKLVVIRKQDPMWVAYVGTADIQRARIADRWCEVQCKITGGQAVRQLYQVFFDRWIEHTEVRRRLPSQKSWLPDPASIPIPPKGPGSFVTQTAATYGNPRRANPLSLVGPPTQVVNQPHRIRIDLPHLGWASLLKTPLKRIEIGNDFFLEKDPAAPTMISEAAAQSPTYAGPRAPGQIGIYAMLLKAIFKATQFIYFEDQYLVCDKPMGGGRFPPIVNALATKLRDHDFKKLIILCTRLDEINDEHLNLAGPHRRNFIQTLMNADTTGDKLVVCQYRSNSDLGLPPNVGPPTRSPFYVHSKTWIFDDEYLITGSANCNRRGYSHDSELDIGVYDPAKTAIRDLRIRLWLRRLNTEKVPTLITEDNVHDPISGAAYWEKPTSHGLTIENHRDLGLDRFLPGSGGNVVPAVTPFDQLYPLLPVLGQMTASTWIWDTVVDPDGA